MARNSKICNSQTHNLQARKLATRRPTNSQLAARRLAVPHFRITPQIDTPKDEKKTKRYTFSPVTHVDIEEYSFLGYTKDYFGKLMRFSALRLW